MRGVSVLSHGVEIEGFFMQAFAAVRKPHSFFWSLPQQLSPAVVSGRNDINIGEGFSGPFTALDSEKLPPVKLQRQHII